MGASWTVLSWGLPFFFFFFFLRVSTVIGKSRIVGTLILSSVWSRGQDGPGLPDEHHRAGDAAERDYLDAFAQAGCAWADPKP